MARERWPKARRSSGANQRALRRSAGFFFLAAAMLFPFSVILSAAKDLIAVCNRHEILRCAQDDGYISPPIRESSRMKLLLTHVPQARRQYYGARALARLQELLEVTLHEGEAPPDTAGVIAMARGVDF